MQNTHAALPSQSLWAIRLVGLLERTYFNLSQIQALPSRVVYARSFPREHFLSYADLLDLRRSFPAAPKPIETDTHRHQEKWAHRVAQIARAGSCRHLLEVGCGWGYAALSLYKAGFEIEANDLLDIRAAQVRESGLRFSAGDACTRLPYADRSFDLVFSINSMEHFDRPAAALDEMLRVLRPGGLLFLTFDPLYFSPWGLHASRRLGMPYPQLLFSAETIQRFVDENRAELAATYSPGSDTSTIGPYLNGCSLGYYRQMFAERRHRLALLTYTERRSYDGLQFIHRYAPHLKSRASSFDDLIVSGIKLLGRKSSQ